MNTVNPLALLIIAICAVIGAIVGQTLIGLAVGLIAVLGATVVGR